MLLPTPCGWRSSLLFLQNFNHVLHFQPYLQGNEAAQVRLDIELVHIPRRPQIYCSLSNREAMICVFLISLLTTVTDAQPLSRRTHIQGSLKLKRAVAVEGIASCSKNICCCCLRNQQKSAAVRDKTIETHGNSPVAFIHEEADMLVCNVQGALKGLPDFRGEPVMSALV